MAMEYEIQFCGHDTDDGAICNVILDGECFETLLTHNPLTVETWIRETEICNRRQLQRLIVGLDIEWRPNTISGEAHPVVIVQLVVFRRFLVYQFQQVHQIPEGLKMFLKNPNYTFVGVGIEDDKQKLLRDHSLEVTKTMAYELQDPDLRNAGLKKLAKVILCKDVDHEEVVKVRMSNWESNRLSNEQVLYACLDAYLSFEIGRKLSTWYVLIDLCSNAIRHLEANKDLIIWFVILIRVFDVHLHDFSI